MRRSIYTLLPRILDCRDGLDVRVQPSSLPDDDQLLVGVLRAIYLRENDPAELDCVYHRFSPVQARSLPLQGKYRPPPATLHMASDLLKNPVFPAAACDFRDFL